MNKFFRHIISFPYVWVLILVLLAGAVISLYNKWDTAWWFLWPSIVFIFAFLFFRPLNVVYGLMGTSGSITVFFLNFIFLCVVFSAVYYFGFFKTAGICYDVNQPHVRFEAFADSASKIQFVNLFKKSSLTQERTDTVSYEETVLVYSRNEAVIRDTTTQRIVKLEKIVYQNIDYQTVLRNTIMTFLMQEPTDLFSVATTYNSDLSGAGRTIDKQKSEQFHWILILQVLVGWIFFGVFISLLYNKFRYES